MAAAKAMGKETVLSHDARYEGLVLRAPLLFSY